MRDGDDCRRRGVESRRRGRAAAAKDDFSHAGSCPLLTRRSIAKKYSTQQRAFAVPISAAATHEPAPTYGECRSDYDGFSLTGDNRAEFHMEI